MLWMVLAGGAWATNNAGPSCDQLRADATLYYATPAQVYDLQRERAAAEGGATPSPVPEYRRGLVLVRLESSVASDVRLDGYEFTILARDGMALVVQAGAALLRVGPALHQPEPPNEHHATWVNYFESGVPRVIDIEIAKAEDWLSMQAFL